MNENAVSVDAFQLPEDTLAPTEDRRLALELMWQQVANILLKEVYSENPRAWMLWIARQFLRDSGYRKDIQTGQQIREAMTNLEGLDLPLIDN